MINESPFGFLYTQLMRVPGLKQTEIDVDPLDVPCKRAAWNFPRENVQILLLEVEQRWGKYAPGSVFLWIRMASSQRTVLEKLIEIVHGVPCLIMFQRDTRGTDRMIVPKTVVQNAPVNEIVKFLLGTYV